VRVLKLLTVIVAVATASACKAPDSPATFTPTPGTVAPGGPTLTAPAPDSPADDFQTDTFRPTLTVRNGTSDQPSGTRTYEFQISDRSDFLPSVNSYIASYVIVDTSPAVPEGSGGKTSYTPSKDLQPSTQMFWHARVLQGGSLSDWSPVWRVRTKLTGYNRAGELYDTLTSGNTMGERGGSTTFMGTDGIKLNDQNSWVRYVLAQTLTSGEMSVEVKGLAPNGPGGKLKVFSMMDGGDNLISSHFLFNVQYRGVPGNPDNCISFKALYGTGADKFEPDLAQRNAARRSLNPNTYYLFQVFWSNTIRVVVKEGGATGPINYELTIGAPTGSYNPTPHTAYIGARAEGEDGTFPGTTYRNFWVGNKPRPTSLGSALSAGR
jgi:hypothetical protein